MFNSFARLSFLVASCLISVPAIAGDSRTMSVSIFDSGETCYSVIRVSDGTSSQELAAIAKAVNDMGIDNVSLTTDPIGGGPEPTDFRGDKHAGIRFTGETAEIFASDGVQIKLIQKLSENLRELAGIKTVILRASGSKGDNASQRTKPNPFSDSSAARTISKPAGSK